MAKHRNNPNMAFWKMIKEGYDHFEMTRQEPKVDFCEKKYVFDAAKAPDAKPRSRVRRIRQVPGLCDPRGDRHAVREKEQRDEAEYSKLDLQGHAGGAHEHRHRRRHEQDLRREDSGRLDRPVRRRRQARRCRCWRCRARPAPSPAPSIRRDRISRCSRSAEEPVVAVATTASTPPTRVAAAQPADKPGFFSSLARKVGLGATADATPASAPPPPPAAAKPKVAEAKPQSVVRVAPKPEAKQAETKQAAAKPALKPSVTDAAAAPAAATASAQVAGSAPIVSPNSFDSRFGAMK